LRLVYNACYSPHNSYQREVSLKSLRYFLVVLDIEIDVCGIVEHILCHFTCSDAGPTADDGVSRQDNLYTNCNKEISDIILRVYPL